MSKRISGLGALLGLLLLASACQAYFASPPAGQGVPTAYPPPPVWTEEPTEPPLPTMTPWPTVPTTPTPTYPPGPPKPTPEVTPILPFPTPAFPPAPQGPRPAALETIWYPYLPSPDAYPVLKAVLVDKEGRRWGEAERTFDFPPGGGTDWRAFYISPDGRSFVADVGYHEESRSFWVNPASGELKPVSTDPEHEDFLAWGPDGQIFAWNNLGEVWLLDMETQQYRVFQFPRSEYGFSLLRTLAMSPDESTLADLCIYGPTVSHPGSEITVSIQPSTGGDRLPIATLYIPEGADVPGNYLTWSPDGRNLAFVLLTGMYDNDPANNDSQLWLIDKNGTSRIVAHGLTGYYPVAWSPVGQYIAYIRAEEPAWRASPADLWLFDLTTSTEIQLTRFDHRRYVTSVAWSPDGRRLAFAVTVEIGDSIEGFDKIGDYGEIWMTSLDGQEQYPIAGPTAPDAPVAWLRAMEGGQ